MSSGPITSWQIEGGNVEAVTDFLFLGSKITSDGDCSHEIRRQLLLGRKAMTKLDSVLKSKDISLPTKVRIVKALVFPVVMYRCESWTFVGKVISLLFSMLSRFVITFLPRSKSLLNVMAAVTIHSDFRAQ